MSAFSRAFSKRSSQKPNTSITDNINNKKNIPNISNKNISISDNDVRRRSSSFSATLPSGVNINLQNKLSLELGLVLQNSNEQETSTISSNIPKSISSDTIEKKKLSPRQKIVNKVQSLSSKQVVASKPRVPPRRIPSDPKQNYKPLPKLPDKNIKSRPPSQTPPQVPLPSNTRPTSPLIRTQKLNNMNTLSNNANITEIQFWEYIHSSNIMDIKRLLSFKSEFVNNINTQGNTPLSFAIQSKNTELVKLLLQQKADPMKKTAKGTEPIHIACERGNVEICQLLLDYNASLSSRNIHTDKSPLHYAASSNSVKIVEWAISRGADVNFENRFGISPVYVAVSMGSEPIVRTLLTKNANPNSQVDGTTLLHMACMNGYYRVACLLLRQGAVINIVNSEGKTPLQVMHLQPTVDEGFGGQGRTPVEGFLHWIFLFACASDDPTLVNGILRDVPHLFSLERSSKGYCSVSALSEAVTTIGSMRVATCLIEHGAPVKVPEENLPCAIFEKNNKAALRAVCESLLAKDGGSKKKKKLDLSGCNLHTIPEALVDILYQEEKFNHVRTIDVSNNLLHGLPPSLLKLKHLERVKVEGNPLDMIPETFRKANSWVKIREYLKTVTERAQKWKSCKLLVVGQEGVGKTTLIRSLQSKNGKTHCKQNIATNGIEIKSMNIYDTESNEKDDDINLLVWDLGGQEIFYPTHQFYLTSNSIYIICFDLSTISKKNLAASSFEEVESRISYWIFQVRELTHNSTTPVILVGTHADKVQAIDNMTKEAVIEEQINLLRLKFPRQRFPGLIDIISVSCKTGERIQELRSKICKSVRKKGFLPQVSESWVKLHDYILSIANDTETTTRNNLIYWAKTCDVPEDQISMVCEFLRDMGTLLTFHGPELEDLVVLNPTWLTSVMSSLITFKHSWVKEGTLPRKDVCQVFSTFPQSMHETLLTLLEKFSILFRIKLKDRSEILVPSLLPTECRASVLAKEWPQRQKNLTEEYGRIYRFPFLPLGFFGRIMVRILHLPNVIGKLFWRFGMVVYFQDPRVPSNCKIETTVPHLALLEYDPVQFQFSIRVRVPITNVGKNLLLQTLVDCVDTILEEYCMRESAERLIPCTHCIDLGFTASKARVRESSMLSKETLFLFSFSECVLAITEGTGHVFCNHIRSPSRMVNVDRLAPDIALSGIPLIDDKQLELGDILGRGGFGIVYRAKFQPLTNVGRINYNTSNNLRVRKTRRNRRQINPTQVAVKELYCEDKSELILMYADFQQEVFVMSKMRRHPNIVRLYGVCLFPKPRMILELLPLGDLSNFLHPKDPEQPDNIQTFLPPSEFSWKLRILIALDIAKGMYVLHSQTPAIIHRDLRSPNIFLASIDEDAHIRAKVADFGLARIVAPTVSGMLNTWQWLAPEVIGGNTKTGSKSYGCSSDVYSFAIVCWEIATGGYPFDEYNDDPRFSTGIAELKNAIINDNLRPTLLPSAEDGQSPIEGISSPKEFTNIIQDCWQTDPEERPTFEQIIDRLSKMVTLTSKQQTSLELLKAPENIQKEELQKLSSSRISIQFTPLEITNIIQKKSGNIEYHSEYILIQKYNTPSSVIKSAVLIDSVTQESPSFWVGCTNGKLLVWSISGTKVITEQIALYNKSINNILLHNKNYLWISTIDGIISIWNIQKIELEREWTIRRARIISLISVNTPKRKKQVWIICEHTIHIYYEDQLLHILNVSKKHSINSACQYENFVWVGVNNEIYLYDVTTLDLICNWKAHTNPIYTITPIGDNFIWTTGGREIRVWKINNMEITCTRKWEVESDCTFIYYADKDDFIWSSIGNRILIWDPFTHKPLQEITLELPGDNVERILKSNFSDFLYSISSLGTLQSWAIRK